MNSPPTSGRRFSPNSLRSACCRFIFPAVSRPRARDLVELVQHASDVGLYSNLITSAVLLSKERLTALADAGLCHVQISFQGNEPPSPIASPA